jgi:hypothetical protein
MLRTRTLTSVEDLNRYAELYFSKSGILVKFSYLKSSHVRIFYKADNPEKWVAGYVQNGNGDLRYFQSLPSVCQENLLAQIGVSATDILETGCTFIDRVSPFERHQVYLMLIAEAYESGKSVLLGGSIIPKVQNYQMLTMPHLLIEKKMDFDGKKILMKQYYGFRSDFLRRSVRLFFSEFQASIIHTFKQKVKRMKSKLSHTLTPSIR